MSEKFSDLGSVFIIEGWAFTNPEGKSTREFIKGMKTEDKSLCLLAYIAELLKPISEKIVAEKEAEKQKNLRRLVEPLGRKLDGMYKGSDNKAVRRILKSLDWNDFYNHGDNRVYWNAQYLTNRRPSEWEYEVIKHYYGVGKKTLKEFKEYQESIRRG